MGNENTTTIHIKHQRSKQMKKNQFIMFNYFSLRPAIKDLTDLISSLSDKRLARSHLGRSGGRRLEKSLDLGTLVFASSVVTGRLRAAGFKVA